VNPSGSIKWVSKCGFAGNFTMTASADNLLYAASDDKCMYVLNSNGKLMSEFIGTGYLSYPVIAGTGEVYVSDSSGALWMLKNDCTPGYPRMLWRVWDATKTGESTFADLAVMGRNWQKTTWDYRSLYTSRPSRIVTTTDWLVGDLNRDAYVDFRDLMIIAEDWLSVE
jgi:hypothetical protein